jgi:hypothetical protein
VEGKPKQSDDTCSVCGGEIRPHGTSNSGYQHVPGLPWCDSKPPTPAPKERVYGAGRGFN